MNERAVKSKKHSRQGQQTHLDKHSSVKVLQAHCLPKEPPNIAAFTHYAHPRKQDHRQDLKENAKHHINQPNKQHRNVLLQPRKSNQGEQCLRKTQKRIRNRPVVRSEWVSPEDEVLGCHEHLSSQIFRQSGQNSVYEGKVGQQRNRPLTAQQQLQLFEQQLASLNWHEQQASIQEMISLEEELSRQDLYSHCLHRQPHITWKTRAVTLDWAAQVATQHNCRREAFALAVNLLDRYLAATSPLPLSKLQLTATACLLLGQKLEDNSRVSIKSFHALISQGYSEDELKEQEKEVLSVLKFRLRCPTANSWASWLCEQWDLWAQSKEIDLRFKAADNESYSNWRVLTQFIDFSLLDLQTLQYKNRTLAASFLYLTLVIRMGVHSPEEVAKRFRRQSKLILAETAFNQLYSRFMLDVMGFPLEEILPTVQYCSGFVILPLTFEYPQLEKKLVFEEFCGYQTWNEFNKAALNELDRSVW